ncbi:MAG: hypothetical protein ABH872_01425 [Candidatus Omnitrophota bacterium]
MRRKISRLFIGSVFAIFFIAIFFVLGSKGLSDESQQGGTASGFCFVYHCGTNNGVASQPCVNKAALPEYDFCPLNFVQKKYLGYTGECKDTFSSLASFHHPSGSGCAQSTSQWWNNGGVPMGCSPSYLCCTPD